MPETAASSPAAEEVPKTLKEEILALHERRAAMEATVQDALAYLASTPVGMDEPLIDADGFPRNDCDLYAVRTARNTVVCGRNDLRALSEVLFDKLGELHEDSKEEAAAQMAADEAARARRKAEAAARQQRAEEVQRMGRLPPLLRVAAVEAGSPAAEAGLTRGALVLQYGSLNAENVGEQPGGLQAVAGITKDSEGKMLSVWVRADGEADAEVKELFIVPQPWAGKGLLGCALDPVA